MSTPDWVREDTASSDDEVARVHPGPPEAIRKAASNLTASTDDEVLAFERRLRSTAPVRHGGSLPVWAGVGLVAAVAALMLYVGSPPVNRAPDVVEEVAESVAVDSGIEGVTASGLAELRTTTSATGTTMVLESGMARIDVERDELAHFDVDGTEVELWADHASFDLQTFDGLAHVAVHRGKVTLAHGAARILLEEGDSWTTPHGEPVVALAPSPPDEPPLDIVADTPEDGIAAVVADDVQAPVAPVVDAIEAARIYSRLLDEWEAGESAARIHSELTSFIEANPDSPLRTEAAALRLEVAAKVEPPKRVIAHIDMFLAVNPAYPRRLGLLELRATLARAELRDCKLALPTYRRLAEEASGDRAIRASAWQGLCAAETGQTAEAIRALGVARDARVTGELGQRVERALMDLDVGP